jgi:phage baseplate assembly protein W
MIGTDERTGKLIRGAPYLRQSIRRVIRTPKKSMPMHRWFGADLVGFIGENITEEALLDLTSAVTDALALGLPGLKLETLSEVTEEGLTTFTLSGSYENRPFKAEGI